MLTWWRRQKAIGLVVFAGGALLLGLSGAHAAVSVAPTSTSSLTLTRTATSTETATTTKTIRVRGRVIRRRARTLFVYVPRVIVRTDDHRIVVPAHVVRLVRRPATPSEPPVNLVAGVGAPPTTVTVPVTVTIPVPGPTSTVVSTIERTATTTQTAISTVYVTVTVPVVPDLPGGSR